MEKAALRAVNLCTGLRNVCVHCLLKAGDHYRVLSLLVVWSRPDPIDHPPPEHPLQRQQLTLSLTGHQQSSAPWENTTCLTPVPSIVKMSTFGRVVIASVFLYFDRHL